MVSSDDLRNILSKPGYGVVGTVGKADRPVPHPEPKRHKVPALDRADAGKKESVQRIVVRFTGYRVRPLDPDNFAGSVKDLLDGLRHSGLIPGDEPWRIKLETDQEKVRTYKMERTEIEIIYP